MASTLLAPLMLLAGNVVHAESSAPENYLSPATGDIVVASDGRVEQVVIKTRLGLDIVAPLEKMIATWRFQPQGAAQTQETRRMEMHLLLAAQMWPEQDRIRIGIQDARFHVTTPRYVKGKLPDGTYIRSPEYPKPPKGVKGRLPHARMMMLVLRDEDGRVVDVELVQGWHVSYRPISDEDAKRWQEAFLANVREAARDWIIQGAGDSRCVFVPVVFHGFGHLWNHARPMLPAPLQGPCGKDFGSGDIQVMGEMKPVEPISKLLPEVWATTAGD